MNKKALGKGMGINALFGIEEAEEIREIDIFRIRPDKKQARKSFESESLNELAESIKRNGIIQPILVREEQEDTYTIIAGERRWRASKIAGLKTIPAIIKNLTDLQIIEVSLIENLQREDLNPIEEANAYERLQKEFNKTQEEISEIVGKSRSTITNSLRLLKLDPEIIKLLEEKSITPGHARAILSVENVEKRTVLLKEIIDKELNVRQAEELAKRVNIPAEAKKVIEKRIPEVQELETKLQKEIGTKVRLTYSKGKGKIIINYYNDDDLERILEMLNVT